MFKNFFKKKTEEKEEAPTTEKLNPFPQTSEKRSPPPARTNVHQRPLIVGDIVRTMHEILGNPEGTEGVVYENYNLGNGLAASVIFENGEYDGFSPKEQEKFLKRVGYEKTLSNYKFENVIKLSKDFAEGIFRIVSG